MQEANKYWLVYYFIFQADFLIYLVPIIEDARHPWKYRMLVGMVDCVFADVAQPDQTRIVALNSHHFLKTGGHFVISIKASCIDSTAKPEAVFANEVKTKSILSWYVTCFQ